MDHLHSKLEEAGFTRCMSDHCLYYKCQEKNMTIVGVYVDYQLVTATLQSPVADFHKAMHSLSIKDLGQMRKFLGMRVDLSEDGEYNLDQQPTTNELIDQAEA